MKPTEERLLNAGFEKLGNYLIKEMSGGYIQNSACLNLGLHLEDGSWWVNGKNGSDNILDNIGINKGVLTEEILNNIHVLFTGKTLNFEPQPQSAYKGHEERIKELEEKVEFIFHNCL